MLDIQQKRRFRSFLYHKFTLGALFLIVILSLHSTWSVWQKKKESILLKESSAKRLADLEKRNEELDMKINKLNTTSGVEEEIRSKFSVAKDNENVVIILNEEGNTASSSAQKTSFWSKIKSFFK